MLAALLAHPDQPIPLSLGGNRRFIGVGANSRNLGDLDIRNLQAGGALGHHLDGSGYWFSNLKHRRIVGPRLSQLEGTHREPGAAAKAGGR